MEIFALIIAVLVILGSALKRKLPSPTGNGLSRLADYETNIIFLANRHGLPVRRIKAIILTESNADQNAIGSVGEVGLMQVTHGAIEDVNFRFGTTFTKSQAARDAFINLQCGTGYLKICYEKVAGMPFKSQIDLATQSYNVGYPTVLKNPSAGENYLQRVKEKEKLIQ